jgi:hypothetical protein
VYVRKRQGKLLACLQFVPNIEEGISFVPNFIYIWLWKITQNVAKPIFQNELYITCAIKSSPKKTITLYVGGLSPNLVIRVAMTI